MCFICVIQVLICFEYGCIYCIRVLICVLIRAYMFCIGGWGGESFVTPPTGKSCFVFVFALRACARRDARSVCVSRHVFVPAAAAPAAAAAPPAAASR